MTAGGTKGRLQLVSLQIIHMAASKQMQRPWMYGSILYELVLGCREGSVSVCAICWLCSKRKQSAVIHSGGWRGYSKCVATFRYQIFCDIKARQLFLPHNKIKHRQHKSCSCTVFALGAIFRLKRQGRVSSRVSLTRLNQGSDSTC